MQDEYKDLVHYLTKAAEYRQKANVVREPRLKAALEAIAQEYIKKARELDPKIPSKGED
jgi:hypothetical protein